MGLFQRKPDICPICDAEIPASANKLAHWSQHAYKIPPGQPGAGGFTWTCSCGPSTQYWPQDVGAAAGLGFHMQQRHGIQLV